MKRLESLTGKLDVSFPHYDNPPLSPEIVMKEWLARARSGDVREPDAYTLATRSADGDISMRTMFPVRFDGDMLLFATHSCSRKGQDINSTGSVGCHIYWRELGRQLSLSGSAVLAPDHVADAVWNARDPAYDPVSTASYQSAPFTDISLLFNEVAKYDGKSKLPRPERFVVYQLMIARCEFWAVGASRIHKRLVYKRTEKGWGNERLQP
ncbi:pyridoxamine 5'-phosphate oxidase family protein [Xenorhabdus bovienii]|uniref:Pyridoxamine 5'-phosphate oxidase family protein n=1 Tax=Xenorhabdus bovienii TaxID=40576 RepID=A0AAJ1N5T2_XENBV|nr:pyridoxamine 5'-phosphate oxidase family protein [Xenorhabdus bovienii]MDE1479726.1 pyridoxamine 5'-phosphate oxidase family protein [Xenorhabdus bovienii]MDE1491157.1 pyridoxamine 5'-phosphate oxidase family protein [Xenorhabdus bovienii]MDE9511545.1 pyridoxamine 5'-phosphate oxidase family protein [Xenorhabdus bovienii]MDE9523174.1 pyridoxamine 5'-phosphate oxidase family protein [Xenorhabdus bovienii]